MLVKPPPKPEITKTNEQVPIDLKKIAEERAKRKPRSVNEESMYVLTKERLRQPESNPASKDKNNLDDLVRLMHDLPTLECSPVDEILYDEDGMPK